MYAHTAVIVALLSQIVNRMPLGDIGCGPNFGCGSACASGLSCPPVPDGMDNGAARFSCPPYADVMDVDDIDDEATQSASAMESFSRAIEVIGELREQDLKQHGKSVQDGVNLLIKHWRNFEYNEEHVT